MSNLKFSVEHLGLAARETTKLAEWYQRVLGAELVFTNGQTPPAFFLALPGGLMIEIYPAKGAVAGTDDNGNAGWRHVALRVASISETRAQLETRGVQFSEPVKPAGGGGSVLFFKDPEGNLLHLIERPAGSLFEKFGARTTRRGVRGNFLSGGFF